MPRLRIKSENWGGIASFIGDLVLCLSGDIPGIAAMIAEFSSDLMLTRYGHKKGGYAAGCLLIAIGDTLFAAANAAANNTTLQIMLGATAVVYAIGACRYPLDIMANKIKEHSPVAARQIQTVADKLPPVVGALSFLFLLPAMISSAIGGNVIAFITTFMWGITDIMVGRVQDHLVRPAHRLIQKFRV